MIFLLQMLFHFLLQLKGLYLIIFPKRFFHKNFPNLNENKEYDFIRTPFAASLKYDHTLKPARE
jgi:hypothetical protein